MRATTIELPPAIARGTALAKAPRCLPFLAADCYAKKVLNDPSQNQQLLLLILLYPKAAYTKVLYFLYHFANSLCGEQALNREGSLCNAVKIALPSAISDLS